MVSLTIKDVPDSIHREIKKAAKFTGRSLNSYVISLLQMSVDERARRRMMREGRQEFRRFLASLPRLDDSTRLIREDRDRGMTPSYGACFKASKTISFVGRIL